MNGSIREKRPGVWEIMVELPRDSVTDHRRRKWATVKGTKRKAQFELHKMLVEAQDAKARTSSASLAIFLAEWLKWLEPRLAATTLRSYRRVVKELVRSDLGAMPLDEITTGHIDRAYGQLTSGGMTYYVLRQTHAALRGALNQALTWGQLDRNPASRASLPQAPSAQISSPSVEQLAAILHDAEALHPQWTAMIALATVTGMRRGEILALRWNDISAGVLNVRRSLTYTAATGTVEGPTKTRQARKVALDHIGMAVVERQREALREAAETLGISHVANPFLFFAEPDGATTFHPDSITKVFRRLADAHGWRELHFHSLRHFTATQLIAAGVDIRTVSGRLGHSDPSVTLRVYSHVLEAKDREAAEIMGRLLGP